MRKLASGMFGKPLADINNRKLQKIMEKAANYSWKLTHIKGTSNKIADALSRLCTKVCMYSHYYDTPTPRLLSLSKRAAVREKQLEIDDPLVENIANEGNLDVEYLSMMNMMENNTENRYIPADCELKQLSGCKNTLSLIKMGNGTRLIIRNGQEILIPKSMRDEMTRVLHLSHQADTAMTQQAKAKIFWPGMKKDLKRTYDGCEACQKDKTSKANENNEISQENI